MRKRQKNFPHPISAKQKLVGAIKLPQVFIGVRGRLLCWGQKYCIDHVEIPWMSPIKVLKGTFCGIVFSDKDIHLLLIQ
jgi:hypothetical protein